MNNALPPLLIGDATAKQGQSFAELQESIEHDTPAGWSVEVAPTPQECPFKFNTVAVGDTDLLSYSVIGSSYTNNRTAVPVLCFPFEGDFNYHSGRQEITERAGKVASITAAGPLYDGVTAGGWFNRGVAFSPEPVRLAQTLRAMSGRSIDKSDADALLEVGRALPLQHRELNIFASFRHLMGLTNSLESRPDLLRLLSVEDLIYRHAALALRPDLFVEGSAEKSNIQSRGLDLACAYIETHFLEPIALSTLEAVSGLSARALQYAFRRRFECTPMAWLRDCRLEWARKQLLRPDATTSVTTVATACGFSNLGNFSRVYQARFGEKPSFVRFKKIH